MVLVNAFFRLKSHADVVATAILGAVAVCRAQFGKLSEVSFKLCILTAELTAAVINEPGSCMRFRTFLATNHDAIISVEVFALPYIFDKVHDTNFSA